MGFGEAIQTCYVKYFTFRGRAQRSEYWFFYLFTVLVSIALLVLDAIIGLALPIWGEVEVLGSLFTLATFIPLLSAACRRLHDTNKSGWWQILPFVPFAFMIPGIFALANGSEGLGVTILIVSGLVLVGLIILLIVWLATDSDKGQNRFGPSPKYGGVEDTFS